MATADMPAEEPAVRAAPLPATTIVESIWLRVIGSAVLITASFFADISTRTRVAIVVVCALDLVAALVWRRLWMRNRDFPIVVASAFEGIVAATVLSYVEPQWFVAMLFAYLISIVYVGSLTNRRTTLVVGSVCLVLAIVREVTLPDDLKVGGFPMAMFVFAIVAFVAYAGAHSFTEARAAQSLERLNRALRTVTSQPELAPTLDSITTAARAAIRGETVVIHVRDGDHLKLAAGGFVNQHFDDDRVARLTRWELSTWDRTPLARTVNLGETVVVLNMDDDPRFPEWTAGFRKRKAFDSARALVTVPLGARGEVVGAVSAFFRDPKLADAETVRLLQTYAEHVTLLLVRTQAYDRERQLTARLREADRLKSEFVALASHQLRTPLTATKGFIDTVLFQWNRLDDATRRSMLERAAASADDLGRMLTQLLDLSRIESDDAQLDIGPLHVRSAVDEIVASLSPLLTQEITVAVDDDLVALADRDAFRHVVDNLVANALKFSPPDSHVQIIGSRDNDEVLVEVADEGPGIPLEEHEKIFERFYRASPSRGAGGTGLGLAIAARYTEALGGRIWVESEPGQGASFVVALPAAGGAQDIPEDVEEIERALH